MEEQSDLVAVRTGVVGVVPPVACGLTRQRHHRGGQHEQLDGARRRHQRRREAAQRVGDDHDVVAVAECVDNGLRVLGQAGRLVFAGQVRRDHPVAALAQLGGDQIPARADVARAVDHRERGHRPTRLR